MIDKTHLLLHLILAALCVPVFGFWPVLTLLAVYEVLGVILWLRDSESWEYAKAATEQA